MTTHAKDSSELYALCKTFLHDSSATLMITHMSSQTLGEKLPQLIEGYELAVKAGLIDPSQQLRQLDTLKRLVQHNLESTERLEKLYTKFKAVVLNMDKTS